MNVTEISQEMEIYLHFCSTQKELNKKTLKAYRTDLKQLVQFLAENNLQGDKQGMNSYLDYLHRKYKQRTIKRKIASVKALFNYMEYEERIDFNPFNKLRVHFQEERLLPKSVSSEVIERLLQYMYIQGQQRDLSEWKRKLVLRDICIVELLFMTGIRIFELCELRRETVDLGRGTICVYGKGAKERILPIGNLNVLQMLRKYENEFCGEIQDSFFVNRYGKPLSTQSVRLMLQKYTKEAGIGIHITPHMIRHSFATQLLEEGVDIRIIQQLLGHSSIVTTQIYTNVAASQKRKVLEMYHPRNRMHITNTII